MSRRGLLLERRRASTVEPRLLRAAHVSNAGGKAAGVTAPPWPSAGRRTCGLPHQFYAATGVPPGCTVPFQVSVGGVLRVPTFISIAPTNSATACVSLDQGGTYTTGGFTVLADSGDAAICRDGKIDSAAGAFTQYTAFQLGAAQLIIGTVTHLRLPDPGERHSRVPAGCQR